MLVSDFAFASPIIYTGVMILTWAAREMKIFKPFDPLYHNYNMIFQSSILLSITIYEYYKTMVRENIPITHFVTISHENAGWNQQYLETNTWSQVVMYTFLASKVFEWFDTVALIVNRKKLLALHLWHHATIGVAFYTGYFSSCVLWIGGLNSFIHVIMYAHYANISGIRRFARYLTQLQIFQLFGGVYMNYLSYTHDTNPLYQKYALINGVICMSYGMMFLQFYSKKYKLKQV